MPEFETAAGSQFARKVFHSSCRFRVAVPRIRLLSEADPAPCLLRTPSTPTQSATGHFRFLAFRKLSGFQRKEWSWYHLPSRIEATALSSRAAISVHWMSPQRALFHPALPCAPRRYRTPEVVCADRRQMQSSTGHFVFSD